MFLLTGKFEERQDTWISIAENRKESYSGEAREKERGGGGKGGFCATPFFSSFPRDPAREASIRFAVPLFYPLSAFTRNFVQSRGAGDIILSFTQRPSVSVPFCLETTVNIQSRMPRRNFGWPP